jgi:site-specific DNA recombinase
MAANDSLLPPGSRVTAYFRDSGGDEQERSIDQQRREAEAYCARHHLVLVRVFTDEARPGGTVVGREAFEELIHYCRQMAPDVRRRSPDAPAGVLLWDLKRFARNTLDNAFFKADLRRRGYELVFLSDNIPSGDIGHAYEAMLEWKAQQDLDDISKDVKRGLSDLVSTRGPDGQYLGLCPGRPPTGFRGEPYTLGTKRDGRPRLVQRWVPDPETWGLARRAWEMRVQGSSYTEIHQATRLFQSIGCYATFFRNRIYTGTLLHGAHEYPGFVPAMVPEAWWEAVQLMRKPRYEHRPRLDSSDYALSGLLYCGLCGRAMKADSVPPRNDAGDGYRRRRYRRYTCTGWKQNRDCAMHYLRADVVEEAVYRVLLEEVLLPEKLLQILRDARPDDETRQALEHDAARLEADLVDVEQVLRRLVDAVERSGYSASLAERLAEREKERSELRVRLSGVRERLDRAEAEIPLVVAEDYCSNAREVLAQGTLDDVRALLRSIVVRIEVEPEHGTLIYGFP